LPNANPHPIFARLLNSAANQLAPIGTYNDTVTVEVHY
jgi:spore coat protein U-like protein